MKRIKYIVAILALILAAIVAIPLWILARTCEIYLEIERAIQNKIANIIGWITEWSDLADD